MGLFWNKKERGSLFCGHRDFFFRILLSLGFNRERTTVDLKPNH